MPGQAYKAREREQFRKLGEQLFYSNKIVWKRMELHFKNLVMIYKRSAKNLVSVYITHKELSFDS